MAESVSPTLILSDLDGTLLNHHDYGVGSVPALISTLGAKTPVILVTSKTLPEVLYWRQRLGLNTPFVVENGSAVYLPKTFAGADAIKPLAFEDTGDAYCIALGTPRAELAAFMAPWTEQVISLADCSLADAMQLTGLDAVQARQAQDRSWTLPLKVHDPDVAKEIEAQASRAGYACLQGGRFIHLQGPCDKGDALGVIRQIYDQRDGCSHRIIGLGDNENDRRMLELADIAVVVKSPGSELRLDRKDTIYTSAEAPEGWLEGINLALAN